MPAMNRNVGNIKSIKANPFQSTWSICCAKKQSLPPGNNEQMTYTIEDKPIIHIISKPLKASRLSSLLFSIIQI